ncbi:hypothetical protein AVEN_140385-1 [Araneus ventricosus]|uniref:Uncharacterized protein n=1 Tax=Araneus ventricosus TaxID=182803 RepID=A0A4Y2L6W2_ARAVE|nr:hypothetical protein AVEN_217312-1 [Araneus ventricosus]GBN09336.1 hypothetical protein AVEN_140385-1 [Araneus ventricosus]
MEGLGLRPGGLERRKAQPPPNYPAKKTISISSHHRLKGHLSKPQLVIIDRHRFNSITHRHKLFGVLHVSFYLYSFPVRGCGGRRGPKDDPPESFETVSITLIVMSEFFRFSL